MEQSASSSGHYPIDDEVGNAPATRPYDVFISHAAPDVEKTRVRNQTLATSICHTLQLTGLRVFMEDIVQRMEDILPAEIQDAMRTASVHIAIFSKNYAESPKCLAELCFMVKRGANIIPVFDDVQPWDLCYIEKGAYANAFAQHEHRGTYNSQNLGEWKEALRQVSFRFGSEHSNRTSDHQKLLKSVVNNVLKGVQTLPLEVAKLPVGLDETVQDFDNFMLHRGRNVEIVGIAGMGGSGKTTLAQEFYSRKRQLFGRSSFLSDVREADAKNLLQTLQGKLVKDLLRTDHKIDNLSEGKRNIRNTLRFCPRVLIILDDIDRVDQLDALLPMDALKSGSLVVVTSREEDVLRRAGISWIYKIKGLDPKHARELFCWHAFLQPNPLNGFEHLAENFLRACGGIPLLLKVFGAHLYGNNDKVYWKLELGKVSKILQDDMKSRLKISYDALDMEEKMIFLDIACFFLGEDKNLALRIWDGSGWSGYHGLQTLEHKCLVELDDKNRLKMHDHFRDLGRDVANKASPCRLWRPEHAVNILEQTKGKVEVRGIMAATSGKNSYGYPERTTAYQPPFEDARLPGSFVGLELLAIQGDSFKKRFARPSRDLLWLRWYDCPHISIPPWFSMENLRVLELIDGNFEFLWLWDIEAPLELRELNIYSNLRLQELPDSIGLLIHLEKMVLCDLINMRTLPKEFCNLKSLQHLALRNCESLISLPSHFGNLTNLQHIELNGCSELQVLPKSFGNLVNLQHIEFNGCRELQMLPKSFGNLTHLRHIEFNGCSELQTLQESFGNLTNLQHIQFNGCSALRMLPKSFSQLKLLRYLDLSWCRSLMIEPEMLAEITSLEYLAFTGCEKLEALPVQLSFQGLLRELDLFNTSLQEVPNEFGKLINLEVLRIGSPYLASLPPSLGNLPCLTEMQLDGCRELKFLPESLEGLNLLKHLSIMNSGVQYLSGELGKLKNLQTLSVWNCPISELMPTSAKARNSVLIETADFKKHRNTRFEMQLGLSAILDSPTCDFILPLKSIDLSHTKLSKISLHPDDCPKLEHLSLSCNKYLTEVETLPTTLLHLRMDRCCILKKISGISNLGRLQNLDISGCSEIEELPSLARLSSLKDFKVNGCTRLQSIQGLEYLANLEQLDISECSEIDDLPNLSRLSSLKNLVINGCSKLQGIEFLVHLHSLERLEADGLEFCSLLKTLPEEFCYLKSLKYLELRNCESLRSLPSHFGENLTDLQYLDFSHWENLQMLPNSFGRLKRLRYLDLSFCKSLTIQPGFLENITTLEELNLEYCEQLQLLPSLVTLQGSLRALNLMDTSLRELPTELGNLSNLEVLRIGSPFLTSLPSSLGKLRSLTKLELEGCRKLNFLPKSLGQLTQLAHLSIKWSQVEHLPKQVGLLTNLQILNIWDCPISEMKRILSFRGGMQQLRSIDLRSTKLSHISIPGSLCPNLEHLSLCDNECLFEVKISLTALLTLRLKDCSKLQRLSGIPGLKRLQVLDISGCRELDELPSMAHLSNSLERLEADGCWKLQGIEGLDQLERLTCLKLPAGIWSCVRQLQKLPSETASIVLNAWRS